MSFFELPGLNEVKEKYAAPEGTYDLRIISAKVNQKDGKTNVQCVLEIEGNDDYANVFHYLSMPGPDDDADKKEAKMLFMARFLNQFSVDASNGLETEQLVGSTATGCKLTQEEYEGNLNNKFAPSQLPREA